MSSTTSGSTRRSRGRTLQPPGSTRRRNSATTLASSKSSKSSGSGKSTSTRSLSQSYNGGNKSKSPANRQPSMIKEYSDILVSQLSVRNVLVQMRTALFGWAELYEFLVEAHQFGIGRNGKLHPEVSKFIDTYGSRLMFSVQLATDNICANTAILDKVLAYKPNVFADIITVATRHLTLRIKSLKKKKRTTEECSLDEVFAAPLLSLMMQISKPKANSRFSIACLQFCYSGLLHYALLVPHRCTQTQECQCYKMAGPVESTLEEVVLPAGAKYAPEVLLTEFDKLSKHYKNSINLNFALAMSILLLKGHVRPVDKNMDKICYDLKCLMVNNKEMSRSVLIVRTGAGEYTASGQASDFVVVCLDMILKRMALKHYKSFKLEHVDIIERFYLEKRPMSSILSLDVLSTLAVNRPELLPDKYKKYWQIAKELDLSQEHMKKVEVFKRM